MSEQIIKKHVDKDENLDLRMLIEDMLNFTLHSTREIKRWVKEFDNHLVETCGLKKHFLSELLDRVIVIVSKDVFNLIIPQYLPEKPSDKKIYYRV